MSDDDAMSDAVRRGSEAVKAATGVTFPWAVDVTRQMLAAALDVEEMVNVLERHDDMVRRGPGVMGCIGCDYQAPDVGLTVRHVLAHQVAVIRAEILGDA